MFKLMQYRAKANEYSDLADTSTNSDSSKDLPCLPIMSNGAPVMIGTP